MFFAMAILSQSVKSHMQNTVSLFGFLTKENSRLQSLDLCLLFVFQVISIQFNSKNKHFRTEEIIQSKNTAALMLSKIHFLVKHFDDILQNFFSIKAFLKVQKFLKFSRLLDQKIDMIFHILNVFFVEEFLVIFSTSSIYFNAQLNLFDLYFGRSDKHFLFHFHYTPTISTFHCVLLIIFGNFYPTLLP